MCNLYLATTIVCKITIHCSYWSMWIYYPSRHKNFIVLCFIRLALFVYVMPSSHKACSMLLSTLAPQSKQFNRPEFKSQGCISQEKMRLQRRQWKQCTQEAWPQLALTRWLSEGLQWWNPSLLPPRIAEWHVPPGSLLRQHSPGQNSSTNLICQF